MAAELFQSLPFSERLLASARRSSAPLQLVADKAPSGLLADVGCGVGVVTAMLAQGRPDRRVIGVDPDQRKLTYARMGPGRLSNVEFRQATISDLTPEFQGTFDGIIVADVMYLLPANDWKDFLATCFQLLRPGGVLLLKEAVADGSWKYFKCVLQEEVMVRLLRKTRSSGGLNFRSREFIESILTANSFMIREFFNLSKGYATPHVMWIAARS